MTLKTDLEATVAKTFRDAWTRRDGRVVPDPSSVGLGNDGVDLDGTILYADLSESTALVRNKTKTFAAEVYKTFLYCSARIIRSEGGVITSYDGDRIMAIYIGDEKNSSAVRAALKISYARSEIIQAAKDKQYPGDVYQLKHTVGIDTSTLMAANTGHTRF